VRSWGSSVSRERQRLFEYALLVYYLGWHLSSSTDKASSSVRPSAISIRQQVTLHLLVPVSQTVNRKGPSTLRLLELSTF
jgi:hypothetical protein